MISSTVDVAVCGGGIGGAVLAELLARNGKRVLVLERNLEPPNFLRPELIWPATIETLCSLHPRDVWESEAARPMHGFCATVGAEAFITVDESLLDELELHPWFVDPNAARELLLRRASFELRRGVDVIDVLRDGARIAGLRARDRATGAEFEIAAKLTIGDDGEHSVVRKGCGIDIATQPFAMEFLCFGFDWPASFDPAVTRLWIHPNPRRVGFAGLGAMPFAKGRAAGLVPIRAPIFDANPRIDDVWRAFVELDPAMRDVIGARRFPNELARVRRSFGHASRYGVPGAFILGDAAHPVSPAGGQGANMAIADARVLAPLILAERSDALVEYERRRRTANARSLRFSRAATHLLGISNDFVSSIVWGIARLAVPRRFTIKRFLRVASRSFVESPG